MVIDRKAFIENEFSILSKEEKIVPFRLNRVQEKYFKLLENQYGPSLEGAREIILKARQQGMSSLVLALFTVDFLTLPNSISLCISHRQDSTKLLFKKVKFYIESYCRRHGWDPKSILKTDNRAELENRLNGAVFTIGTAGAKVGGRGGTATKILFSEAAFYPDTDVMAAKEIIEGTTQQVLQDIGMIFIESTANGYGNYYQLEWERAKRGESNYSPRFFSWEEFYTEEWIQKKRKDFQDERMWRQEYPRTEEEAFISSGTPFFDADIVDWIRNNTMKDPIQQGRFATDGVWI